MLKQYTSLLVIQVLHVSDGVIVYIVSNGKLYRAALMVQQIVHELNPLAVRVNLILHANLSLTWHVAICKFSGSFIYGLIIN